MKVSCVITTYNRKDDLKILIDQILGSSFKDLEIVIVYDGNNSDGVGKLLQQEYFGEGRIRRIPLFLFKHKSALECLNLGFFHAKGEYIIVMDDDIEIQQDAIENLVMEMDRLPDDIVALTPWVVYPPIDHKPDRASAIPIGKLWYPLQFPFLPMTEQRHFHGACTIFRAPIIKTYRYFEPFGIYVNEAELGARLIKDGYKLAFVPCTLVVHKSAPRAPEKEILLYRNYLWYIALHLHGKDALHQYKCMTKMELVYLEYPTLTRIKVVILGTLKALPYVIPLLLKRFNGWLTPFD